MRDSFLPVLARVALIAATLALAQSTAFADPPPPFIIAVPAALSSPSGVATDAAGNVYIADTGNNRMLKFNNIGAQVASWGTAGSANGQFNQPWGVAVDASNVYVADSGNNRVQKFTQAGAFVSAWTVAGAHGVAIDGSGNVYVSGTSAIGKYTNAGALVTSWGSAGAGNGQFNAPLGVAVDAAGNVYVADTNNSRVQKFTGAGVYLTQWGGLNAPDGVCVDNGGHVIVAETGGYRVDAFMSTGAPISQWGTQGSGNGQFQLARSVTTSAAGNVLVLDSGNQRLQVFGTVTSTTLGSNANPSVFGQAITLTATVSPATVSSTVTFKDGGVFIGSAGTASGVAVLGLSNLAPGSHALTALYVGDGNSAASTSPGISQQVNQAATSTLMIPAINPTGTGQMMIFNFGVSALFPGAGTPTGNVTISVDGTPSGVGALTAGTGTVSVAAYPSGTHAVVAAYGGDANFVASAAPAVYQVILPQQAPPIYLTQWPTNGSGGNFSSSIQLAADASGNVFIPDYINNHVQRVTNTGVNIFQFGTSGSGPGQYSGPSAVATDNLGKVYVVDTNNRRVQVVNLNGVYQREFGSIGTGDGQFSSASGIAVDPDGNVYVSDITANRIQKFFSWGGFASKWGGPGTGISQFSYPTSIALDKAGNVYVADTDNHRIQKFRSDGLYLTQWGSEGSQNGQFEYPISIVMDAEDNLIVADEFNDRIQKFTSSGAFLTKWGTIGTGPGQFTRPHALAVDPIGNIYVMDQSTVRVQKFFFVQSLATVADVPNDQGHQVRVRFLANGSDNPSAPVPITSYEIYRKANASPLTAARHAVATPARASTPLSAQVDGWDYLLTMPAHTDQVYEAVVPTLSDSNASGPGRSVFFVRAATATPSVFWDSAPDSGYSVDNLPPAVPAPFVAAYANGATALHWGRNTEPDLWYYRIYRGTSSGFIPSSVNLIATRSDTGYVDPGAAGSYYKLSAVDVDGNESGFATLTPGGTLAVGDGPALSFGLAGLHPNPASGNRMSVEFVLVVAAPARLDLLDVSGRLVATHEVGSLGAGRHTVDLASGRHLAPGLYMVRLSQGPNTRSARAVILD